MTLPIGVASLAPRPHTILLVDDTPTNLGVLFEYLEQHGFKVIIARDGEGGIKRAQLVRPNIILLDVMMPGLNGFDTCLRLKAEPSTQNIPVIFMTALASTEDKVRGFAVGAVDYVTKPLQQEEVLARLTTHLKIQDLTNSLQKKNRQLEASQLIGQRITSILDLNQMLRVVAALIQAQFGYYYVGVWLLAAPPALVLQAESGQNAALGLGVGATLALDAPQLAARAAQTGTALLRADIRAETPALGFSQLPATRAELVLPLRFGAELLGVLDIHSDQVGAFSTEDQIALQSMANQIAVAIDNARQYQLAKNQAQALTTLNASKDKLLAVIAHDLRSPFNALLGLSLLQSRTADNTPLSTIREMALRIHNSARNAYDLLENLLQWSSLQLGQAEYTPACLNAAALVAGNLRLLNEVAARKNITLKNAVPAQLQMYADENSLNTVLRNLIANALKFTPTGGQVMVVGVSPPTAPAGFLEMQVQDTGVGISAENIQKLFRLDKPHTTLGTASEHGTGLGLLLCQEMVVKNGGQLRIESVVGQGTTIKFTVPLPTPV